VTIFQKEMLSNLLRYTGYPRKSLLQLKC